MLPADFFCLFVLEKKKGIFAFSVFSFADGGIALS